MVFPGKKRDWRTISHLKRVWSQIPDTWKSISLSLMAVLSYLLEFNFWLLLKDPPILCKAKKQKTFPRVKLKSKMLDYRNIYIWQSPRLKKVGSQLDSSLIGDNPPVTPSSSLAVLRGPWSTLRMTFDWSLTVHLARAPVIFVQEGMSLRQQSTSVRCSLTVNMGESRILIKGFCLYH